MKTETLPPSIDYAKHPAFEPLKRDKTSHTQDTSSDLLAALVEEVDSAFWEQKKSPSSTRIESDAAFDRAVLPRIQALRQATLKQIPDAKTKEWIESCFKMVTVQLRDELRYAHRTHAYRPKASPSPQIEKLVHEMEDRGFVAIPFDPETQRLLRSATKPYFEQLRQMAKEKPHHRVAIPLPMYGDLGKALRRLIRKHGFLEVASRYRRCEMELDYCSMDYSYPGQNWFQDCYADSQIPTSKTAYMHYDYETPMLKAMVYLNESPVSIENGAFGFVPGSHKWQRSPFLFSFFKDLDIQHSVIFGKSKQDAYYRPRFKQSTERERFLSLPKIFQASSHFGDDVLDGSELSDHLLGKEVRFTGNEPACVLFDGPMGIHRGALTSKGERWALQLGLRLREEISAPKRIARSIRRRLGRIRRGQNPF